MASSSSINALFMGKLPMHVKQSRDHMLGPPFMLSCNEVDMARQLVSMSVVLTTPCGLVAFTNQSTVMSVWKALPWVGWAVTLICFCGKNYLSLTAIHINKSQLDDLVSQVVSITSHVSAWFMNSAQLEIWIIHGRTDLTFFRWRSHRMQVSLRVLNYIFGSVTMRAQEISLNCFGSP